MKKLADKIHGVSVKFPEPLYERLLQQVAKEIGDRKRIVTPSMIIRWAVEDYLDAWESATFVPDKEG